MKTAIFLGAGASRAEGAPVQSEIFRDYFEFSMHPDFNPQNDHTRGEISAQLKDFFRAFFEIDFDSIPLAQISFPTFEEALGILDLAELRREAFKKYELEYFGHHAYRIRLIRQYLVLAMATIIDEKLKVSRNLHADLIGKIQEEPLLQDLMFVSTNYDILIDNALSSLRQPGEMIDYGVEFTNFADGNWFRPAPDAFRLFKLHGSLNWLYCPSCNSLTITPFEKGVIKFTTDRAIACARCRSSMNPIIVPPTFFKDMSKVFLSEIWNKAEQALRQVHQIVFCGYSFPDADMYVKYLLKRIQINRVEAPALRFKVINGKYADNPNWEEEQSRYHRFLGKENVAYLDLDFESFCHSPRTILKRETP